MQWITALDLERWAETVASRTDFAGLIADLIRASAPDVTHFRFPTGESGQVRGFDGRVVAQGMPPYVPDGSSVWEFGVGRDYLDKANEDYESRSKDPKDVTPSETTFVFVTPRRWTRTDMSREQWEKSKTSVGKGRWKDVRALDGISLEDWLGQNEAVAARMAREVLGLMPPVAARSSSEFWSEYRARFAPPLTEDVLLAGREEQATQLVQRLASSPSGYLLQADSPEEVVAFAVAAIRRADPELRSYLEARTMILDSEDAARSLSVRGRMVFLPRAGAIPLAGSLGQRNATVVPLGRDDHYRQNSTVLNRPTSDKLEAAIKTMGLADERARQLARTCGRSVTVLARQIASGSALKPQWDGHRQLIPALLSGAWDSASEHDRDSVAAIAGVNTYAAFEDLMLPYVRMQDPPIEREGKVWKMRAPVDAFVHLAPLIGTADIERFADLVAKVFTELDPSLDLPQDERPYAAFHGKNLKHSHWLRNGLATTLLLISTMHKEAELHIHTNPVEFVNSLVGRLPGLAEDYRLIASLEAELPILMEAAPRPLLSALERLLEGDGQVIRPIFQDSETTTFGPHSPHTGLLWALEVLAWDPIYISEATLLLAKLARVDPGGTLMNRPLKSLREIFLAWHSSTNATFTQRFAALDRIIVHEPNVGWQLLIQLLPDSHSIASPTAEPRFQEAGASERETLTYGLVARAYEAIIDRALRLVENDPGKWGAIMSHLDSFSPTDRLRTIELLDNCADDFEGNERTTVWRAVHDLVNRHRRAAFETADWALPSADLQRLEVVRARLEPADMMTRIIWLFDDHSPDIPGGGETPRIEAIELARRQAISDLLNANGFPALLELAANAKYPGIVAASVISVIESAASVENLIESALRKAESLDSFAVALSGLCEQKLGPSWRERVAAAFVSGRWTAQQVATLLLSWRDDRETWNFVASLGAEVERDYWLRKPVWYVYGEPSDLQIAAEKYIQVGRWTAAINAVHHAAASLPTELLFRLLDNAIGEINQSSAEVTNTFAFHVREIFESLQTRAGVPTIEVAKREYAYFPIFGYGVKNLTIHSLLAESPSFFVSVISDVFKPESGENREPTPDRIARARTGYHLLMDFHVVPGSDGNHIDGQVLTAWVLEVRRLAAAEDRRTMADEYIGHLLAHAPRDPEGVWPQQDVSDLIEQVSSDVIERGIMLERFNMRGVTTRGPYEGGDQERELGKQAHDWAKARRAWPRTYALLEIIARRWEKEADDQDVRARQDAMRFD